MDPILEKILTGQALQELVDAHKKIEGTLTEAEKRVGDLTSRDMSVVQSALRVLLAAPREETRKTLPKLQGMITLESPLHTNTPLVLAALKAGLPIWLFGDAGSGKTTTVAMISDILGLPFRFMSVCPTTTKADIIGYRDATGGYQGTGFREVYETGGIFLIDEVDNGNPSILAILNTALANDQCAFPDKIIKRHDFAYIIAAANTIGRGADVRYVGRNALDATTLDRFVFVKMDTDEGLERYLVCGTFEKNKSFDMQDGGKILGGRWLTLVRQVRFACNKIGLEFVVSTRASVYGKKLLDVGVGLRHCEDMCLWKGMRETDRIKVLATIAEEYPDELISVYHSRSGMMKGMKKK